MQLNNNATDIKHDITVFKGTIILEVLLPLQKYLNHF